MVRKGPSRGCNACRASHLKCDQQLPSCGRCVKRGTICSGYKEEFDVLLRDQTASVSHKERLREEKRQRASLSPTSCVLQVSTQERALQAFYASYVPTPQKDGTILTSYFLHMMKLAVDSSPDMAVSSAMPWLSLQMIGTTAPPDILDKKQALLSKTLVTLRANLETATAANQDQILAAILLLDFGQSVDYMFDTRQQPDTHLRGATALINQRDPSSWRTPIGLTFLNLMRTRACTHAMLTGDTTLLLDDAIDEEITVMLSNNPRVILDHWAAHLVKIRHEYETSRSVSRAIVDRLKTLHTQVESWSDRLPTLWHLEKMSNDPDPAFWGTSQDLFYSTHIVRFYVFWYALRIGIIGLFLRHFSDLELSQNDCPSRVQLQYAAREVFNGVCAAVPYLQGRIRHAGQSAMNAYDIAFGPQFTLDRMGSWFFVTGIEVFNAMWDLDETTCPPELKGILPQDQIDWLLGQLALSYHFGAQRFLPTSGRLVKGEDFIDKLFRASRRPSRMVAHKAGA